jgi:hypothetical protein
MSDTDDTRALVRVAAMHAADLAATLDPTVGDLGALTDQFEAAGLDSLAKHGVDVRRKLDGE